MPSKVYSRRVRHAWRQKLVAKLEAVELARYEAAAIGRALGAPRKLQGDDAQRDRLHDELRRAESRERVALWEVQVYASLLHYPERRIQAMDAVCPSFDVVRCELARVSA